MSKEKNESLLELTTTVARIEGFNKPDALLIATAMCNRREQTVKESSLPGVVLFSDSQAAANEKRANDLGDPEKIISEIKNALGENYTREDLLNVLREYR